MSSSTSVPGIAHRSVSSIRAGAGQTPTANQTSQSSPHTPARHASSAFASPSSLRAEEETIVVELSTRGVRVGFAGDTVPNATLFSGPDSQRRVGDFSQWLMHQRTARDKGATCEDWKGTREFWTPDLRTTGLGLVGDRFERLLRDAFTRHLLIDSRPRRVNLILPPSIPIPLLSTFLDTLFNNFQVPTVTLVSSAVMATVAAGVRSALVVDLGWTETTVSSIYEYREIRLTRSVRAGKKLVEAVHNILASSCTQSRTKFNGENHILSIEECEDVANRLVWCRQHGKATSSSHGGGCLATVQEQDEFVPHTLDSPASWEQVVPIRLSLTSCDPPEVIELPFTELSTPCENTFIAPDCSRIEFDDDEMPIPQLIYDHLLALPIDARADCMARIIFTGSHSSIPGLRQRLVDELSILIQGRDWDPIQGKAAEEVKKKRMQKYMDLQRTTSSTKLIDATRKGPGPNDMSENPNAEPGAMEDPVERIVQRTTHVEAKVKGHLRVIESLGPWSGASLATHLKTTAVASIDRDLWIHHGIQGASRPAEVDLKAYQRQSLGPVLTRGATHSMAQSWTLGAWGCT